MLIVNGIFLQRNLDSKKIICQSDQRSTTFPFTVTSNAALRKVKIRMNCSFLVRHLHINDSHTNTAKLPQYDVRIGA